MNTAAQSSQDSADSATERFRYGFLKGNPQFLMAYSQLLTQYGGPRRFAQGVGCHAQRRQTAIDGGHNADKPECLGRTGGRFGHDTISLVEDGFRIQTRRRISSRRSSISQSTRY